MLGEYKLEEFSAAFYTLIKQKMALKEIDTTLEDLEKQRLVFSETPPDGEFSYVLLSPLGEKITPSIRKEVDNLWENRHLL